MLLSAADMLSQIQRRFEILEVSEPQWRVAWRVPRNRATPLAVPLAILASLALLFVDGSDWVATTEQVLGGIIQIPSFVQLSIEGDSISATFAATDEAWLSVGEALAAAFLYGVRHSLLYLAISRWAFEWDRR